MNLLFDIKEPYVPHIEGLNYLSDFISRDEEKKLLSHIDKASWSNDLKRRVQHYGYRYDYKARSINKESYIGALPDWITPILDRLADQQIFANKPDQVIVNEYMPGQGISAHIDCVPCFGDVVVSLSLGSGCIMRFIHPHTNENHDLYLKPCSAVVLQGPARYGWKHAIPARRSDMIDGFKVERERRVSLTFRTVIP